MPLERESIGMWAIKWLKSMSILALSSFNLKHPLEWKPLIDSYFKKEKNVNGIEINDLPFSTY